MIARHGVLPVVIVGAMVLTAHLVTGWQLAIPFWLLLLLFVFSYRDPDREIPSSPLSVVAPADGRVVAVDKTDDPYLKRASLRIDIEMGMFDIFTTRSPVEGKILEPPGVGDEAGHPHGVWLQTDEGDDIVLVMRYGRMHNVPRCYVRYGERIGQGMRCGFIPWGGLISVYLPEFTRADTTVGDSVKAGSDIIASLVHD